MNMNTNLAIYIIIVCVVGILLSIAIYNIIKFVYIIKKYRADVKNKNETWIKENGLSDTTNQTIIRHLFLLGKTNTFVIRKIESNPKDNEISITFYVRDQEVTLDLDLNIISLRTTDFPMTPNIEFTFDPKFLSQEYVKTLDLWENEVQCADIEYFLYQANIVLYLNKELVQKINAPVYSS